MTETYILNIEILQNEGIFNEYFSQMSSYRQEKINISRQKMDKIRSLGIGVLMDKYLQGRGLRERDMTYGVEKNGKPYFENQKGIFFNASHSGKYSVCTFSEAVVGCDIEMLEKRNLRVAKRFFTENENKYIFETVGEGVLGESCVYHGDKNDDFEKRQMERFVRVWTIKESYLKWLGTGLVRALDSFEVVGLTGKKVGIIDNEEKNDFDKLCKPNTVRNPECCIYEMKLDDACIAVCSCDEKNSFNIIM